MRSRLINFFYKQNHLCETAFATYRLRRNIAFFSRLMGSSTDFAAADMPQANRLTIYILADIAQHEREMISRLDNLTTQEKAM